MGRQTFLGGSTEIRVTSNGTVWKGRADDAEDSARGGKRAVGHKPDREHQVDDSAAAAARRKLVRSFISQCVSAYAAGKLGHSSPAPAKALRGMIQAAGGNIRWLEADRSLQALFHESYCRLRGEKIPFEKVWGQPRR